jgi:hypothetical protein
MWSNRILLKSRRNVLLSLRLRRLLLLARVLTWSPFCPMSGRASTALAGFCPDTSIGQPSTALAGCYPNTPVGRPSGAVLCPDTRTSARRPSNALAGCYPNTPVGWLSRSTSRLDNFRYPGLVKCDVGLKISRVYSICCECSAYAVTKRTSD